MDGSDDDRGWAVIRAAVPTEQSEAERLMQLVRLHEPQHPELRRLFHVPNGGARSKAAAGKLKAAGVRKGVPDYLMPVSVDGMRHADRHIGLAIELKRRKGSRVEPEQHDWLEHLSAQGWKCHVSDGHERAWAAICDYLGIRNCLEGGA